MKKWLKRLLILGLCVIGLFFFVVLPVAGSFLITNSRFQYRERGPTTPEAVGLSVSDVGFAV